MSTNAAKLWRTARVLARVPLQRRIPRLSREHLERIRDARIRRLVAHASASVPHYVDLFRTLGLDAGAIRAARDLRQLPLLDKDSVRADALRFVSSATPRAKLVKLRTSGSTGTPLDIYHDVPSMLDNIAHTEPDKEALREAVGRRLGARQLSIAYSGSTILAIQRTYAKHVRLPRAGAELFVTIETPIDEVIRRVNDYRPDIIFGYGSYLEMLFRYATAHAVELRRPKVVLYGADMLTAPGRELIERDFGVRVMSRYSAVEALRIGFTCVAGTGFHVRTDLCDLRVVDGQGRDVPADTPGEIVITNLVNRGSILLNYRIGDRGVLSAETCACGRTLPLLTELQGRQEDFVSLADGRSVHPREIWGALKAIPEIVRYQLIQDDTDRFRLLLTTRGADCYARVLEPTLARLRAVLGSVAVAPEHCAEIPTAKGKFRAVVSNVRDHDR